MTLNIYFPKKGYFFISVQCYPLRAYGGQRYDGTAILVEKSTRCTLDFGWSAYKYGRSSHEGV